MANEKFPFKSPQEYMLEEEEKGGDDRYITMFREHYVPQENFSATYLLKIDGRELPLYIGVWRSRSLYQASFRSFF